MLLALLTAGTCMIVAVALVLRRAPHDPTSASVRAFGEFRAALMPVRIDAPGEPRTRR